MLSVICFKTIFFEIISGSELGSKNEKGYIPAK